MHLPEPLCASRTATVRGCPSSGAGRSRRASCPSLTRMQPALRNPCCAWLHTPAPGDGQPLTDSSTGYVPAWRAGFHE